MKDSGLTIMSNFDHIIDHEVAARIEFSGETADYPGWNFHGTVYFKAGCWFCRVMVYGALAGVVKAETIEELKEAVCSEYGSE